MSIVSAWPRRRRVFVAAVVLGAAALALVVKLRPTVTAFLPIEPLSHRTPEPRVARLIATHLGAASKAPHSAVAHGNLGLVYEANSMWTEARASLRNAAALDPRQPLWQFHAAIVAEHVASVDEAVTELRAAARALPDLPAAHHRLALLLLRVDRIDEAEESNAEARRLAPAAVEPRLVDMAILLARGQASAAEPVLRDLLRSHSENALVRYLLGTALARLGRGDEARPFLRSADAPPRTPLPDPLSRSLERYRVGLNDLSRRADAARVRGDLSTALEMMRGYVREVPASASGQAAYGRALLAAGRTVDAVAAFECAIELDPHRVKARCGLVDALVRAGRLQHAAVIAADTAAASPDDPRVHVTWAQVHFAQEAFEDARVELERAYELDARDATTAAALAELHVKLGRPAPAVDLYESAIDADPGLVNAWTALIALLQRLDRIEEARDVARRAVAVHPSDVRVTAILRVVEAPR